MGGLHGADVVVLRHVLQKDEARAARKLIDEFGNGLPLGTRRPLIIKGSALEEAVRGLLELLARPETGALFVLDGAEHLSTKQIAAIRRRSGHPSRVPELTVGALENARPDKGRKADGSELNKPVRSNLRFRISAVAKHLTSAGENLLTPRDKPKTIKTPRLSTFAIPAAGRDEASRLAEALLEARFSGLDDALMADMPRAVLFAVCDLVTILTRGSKAYVLVLDHEHLDDVADPRALGKYTRPALALEKVSARTIYMRRAKAEKAARVRVLEDPKAKKARVSVAKHLAVKGGVRDFD